MKSEEFGEFNTEFNTEFNKNMNVTILLVIRALSIVLDFQKKSLQR